MSSASSYGWMPGWLRKFLNLDDELPNYEPSSSDYRDEQPARQSYSYAPAKPSSSTYTPPALPPSAYGRAPQPAETGTARFAASYPGTDSAEESVRRFSSFSSAPSSAASPHDESGQRPAGPPPLASRVVASNGPGANGPGANGPGPISQAAANGFVQPVGYAVRSFARGALPPQGIEQFSRELRATATDVWNFYTYWIRFETEDLFQMGRETLDAVAGWLPPVGEEVTTGTQPRRIKVSQAGNGEGNGGTKRATPPPPPAPTAVFSPTVTADDAAVPPGGKDTSPEFAARMAKETAPVAKDVAEASRKAAEGLKADVAALGSAAPASTPTPTPPASAPTPTPTPPAPTAGAKSSTPTPPTPPARPSGASDQSKDKRDKGRK
ncbi:MAG: hypothetical protein HGA45_00115 [Chloroflexales bacterium]|nr:hypothetical protein [Chloroflexales bacterium]